MNKEPSRLNNPMTVLEIKDAVRTRDGYRCTECGLPNGDHIALTGRALEVHRLQPGSPYTVEGCVTLCRSCHGPKPRSARYSTEKTMLKFPRDIIRKARLVCAAQGKPVAKYFLSLLFPLVERDYESLKRQMNREGEENE